MSATLLLTAIDRSLSMTAVQVKPVYFLHVRPLGEQTLTLFFGPLIAMDEPQVLSNRLLLAVSLLLRIPRMLLYMRQP